MAELISYLPPYLQEYKEIKSALNAEDPEFVLLWDASEKVLKNQFIETADEYGIYRFEKLLGVFPSVTEDLESRRSRVRVRWFDYVPYTLKSLILRLTILCGENNFKITKNYDSYEIKIETDLELFGQTDELARIILKIIPCNMNVNSRNELNCECSGNLFIGGAVSFTESFFITNDSNDVYTAKSGLFGSGSSVVTESFFITNDSSDIYTARGSSFSSGSSVVTESFFITNDSNDVYTANGGSFGSGSVVTEIISI